MFPIFNFECSYLEFPTLKTESELLACAKDQLDHVNSMEVTVDGISLQNLALYRTHSQLFNISFPANNLLGPNPATSQALADGFWILLRPLTTGMHEIHFHGSGADFTSTSTINLLVDVMYHLRVQ
jgi:hypothetical protein